MPAYILFDPLGRDRLYPFSPTRPVADCRLGILTIREKWEWLLQEKTTTATVPELNNLFPLQKVEDNYWINGGLLPDKQLLTAILKLEKGSVLLSDTPGRTVLASRSKTHPLHSDLKGRIYPNDFSLITYPWELFLNNKSALSQDFERLSKRPTQTEEAFPGTHFIHPGQIFIESGAQISYSTLNAEDGPIYIGKDAVIMEGSHIRGPVSIGAYSLVKMGAKIYGATTIGPYCVVGGEIKNSILFGFSNKAHDGYLGDSVIAEWCNWGAGTSCSNLKNSAQEIDIWVEADQQSYAVGIKCGVLMGDLSRTAVQTRINSGTVVGLSSHLSGAEFPPRQIPSFYWNEKENYQIEKAIRDAKRWMRLKDQEMSTDYEILLTHIYKRLYQH